MREATQPKAGRHINPKSSAVTKWQRYLRAKHDRALAKVGATKYYDYTITNNGFAARLTGKQAFGLSKVAGVIDIRKDQRATPDTTDSPEYLGLTAEDGLWDQLGGDEDAGAGVVVGVLDTGIWPESDSFEGGTGIPVPSDWNGKCVSGEQFDKNLACNDKLVGARYFVSGFDKHNIAKDDYLSPRAIVQVDGTPISVFLPDPGTTSEPGTSLVFDDFSSLVVGTTGATTTTAPPTVPPTATTAPPSGPSQ